jgi:hypothetical protein
MVRPPSVMTAGENARLTCQVPRTKDFFMGCMPPDGFGSASDKFHTVILRCPRIASRSDKPAQEYAGLEGCGPRRCRLLPAPRVPGRRPSRLG